MLAIHEQLSPNHKVKLDEQGERLSKILNVLNRLQQAIKRLFLLNAKDRQEKYNSLKKKQKIEISSLVPNKNKINEFKKFLEYSQKIVNYERENYDDCLLCKRKLDDQSIKTINNYYNFLKGDLEREIKQLEGEIEEGDLLKRNIANYDFSAVIQPIPLPIKDIESKLNDKIKLLQQYCQQQSDQIMPTSFLHEGDAMLDPEIQKTRISLKDTKKSIESFSLEFEKAKIELAQLTSTRNKLKFKRSFSSYRSYNDQLFSKIEKYKKFKEKISNVNFTNLRSQITRLSNKARENLIIDSFIKNFNEHYSELAGGSLESSGINLKSVKPNEAGDIEPKIKKKYKLNDILGEGQQKIYSLALFFTELDYQKRPIVVLDDPVSSLDYNYSGCVTQKIKNFARGNLVKQIIIFTHDWYFLKDIQDALVYDGFKEKDDFSVHILDNCDKLYLNVEKENEIKQEVENFLNNPGPLNEVERSSLSVFMRRLIETMINKHVFNNQRTQYKRDELILICFISILS